jgi:hypothetical protein
MREQTSFPLCSCSAFLVSYLCFTVLLAVFLLIPPEKAHAAEYGRTSEPGRPTDRDTMTSDTRLPAGPGPGSGGPSIDPKDYGLCGLFGLFGIFESKSVARIVVGSDGYYAVHREWAIGNPEPPVVEWTCARLNEFGAQKLPPNSAFAMEQLSLMTSGGPPTITSTVTDTKACIWAGVVGPLSSGGRDNWRTESSSRHN